MHSEAMLKVPALLLTPSTEPIYSQEEEVVSAVFRTRQLAKGRAGMMGAHLGSLSH